MAFKRFSATNFFRFSSISNNKTNEHLLLILLTEYDVCSNFTQRIFKNTISPQNNRTSPGQVNQPTQPFNCFTSQPSKSRLLNSVFFTKNPNEQARKIGGTLTQRRRSLYQFFFLSSFLLRQVVGMRRLSFICSDCWKIDV